MSLEIKSESQIRLMDFESRTGLPPVASLEELELLGGRYFSSKPIQIGSKPSRIEYIFLDPLGVEQEVYVWKRLDCEGDFTIHLETRTTNKY